MFHRKFYTNFGALTSVIIYIVLLINIAHYINQMVSNKESGITNSQSVQTADLIS